ncbi:cytosolic Fe-S cluster assembly factor NUBP2 homolog isoform X3 [Oculina patagonica]
MILTCTGSRGVYDLEPVSYKCNHKKTRMLDVDLCRASFSRVINVEGKDNYTSVLLGESWIPVYTDKEQ